MVMVNVLGILGTVKAGVLPCRGAETVHLSALRCSVDVLSSSDGVWFPAIHISLVSCLLCDSLYQLLELSRQALLRWVPALSVTES